MAEAATVAASTTAQDWMTTDEFNAWYARLGLSEIELAGRLEVKQPTVNRWRHGERKPPGFLRLALERLAQVLEAERNPPTPKRRRPQSSDPS